MVFFFHFPGFCFPGFCFPGPAPAARDAPGGRSACGLNFRRVPVILYLLARTAKQNKFCLRSKTALWIRHGTAQVSTTQRFLLPLKNGTLASPERGGGAARSPARAVTERFHLSRASRRTMVFVSGNEEEGPLHHRPSVGRAAVPLPFQGRQGSEPFPGADIVSPGKHYIFTCKNCKTKQVLLALEDRAMICQDTESGREAESQSKEIQVPGERNPGPR